MRKQTRVLPCLLVALGLVLSTACGSVSKTAYAGLSGLKGAYVAANDMRNGYCAPKADPKPSVCKNSNDAMLAAYHVLSEGTHLLEAYATNKDAAIGSQLTAISAELPSLVLQVTLIVSEFKSALGTASPPPVAAPVAAR